MDKQKQDLRDWVAKHQSMFESAFADMLLAKPVDPKQYLIDKFESLLNDNDSNDNNDDSKDIDTNKDKESYAEEMKAYLKETQSYFEDVFTTLLMNQPNDPRSFMLQILKGEIPLSSKQQDEVPNQLEKMEVPSKYRRRNRRAAVSAEVDDEEEYVARIIPKDEAAKKRINDALSKSFLFGSLDSDQKNQVVDAMEGKAVSNGDVVIQEGDAGDYFYIIDHGTFDVLKNIDDEEKKVFFYDNKGSFGELALMYNTPRAATVKATSDGYLWAVDRATFRHTVIAATREQRKSYETFLVNVDLFRNLIPSERSLIADCLEPREYKDGEAIINQGDEGDKFFLIEKGECVALQKHDDKDVEVGRMKVGQFFGERALLTNEKRAATVKAVGRVKVAAMARDAFERLLGDCKDVMHRQMKKYESAHEILAKNPSE